MSDAPLIQLSGETGVMTNYENAVCRNGGVPRSGYCPTPDLDCAGLLLCGGGDLAPGLFGQENQGSDPPDLVRDRAELELFRAFWDAGKPVLGICRGMQVINVALGGTLIQDLPPAVVPFHGRAGHDLVHPLRTRADSLIDRLYGPHIQVNSCHHQAVERLGQGLAACAWSESGFAEAIQHTSRPILGVQFHPERMSGALRRPDTIDGDAIFRVFLSWCMGEVTPDFHTNETDDI